MLSIIIPTYNEIKNNYVQKTFPVLAQLQSNRIEIIIVDSNSDDGTVELAKEYGFKIVQVETTSRAKRLNIGIENSNGDCILFHHPRSFIDPEGIDYLDKYYQRYEWGAFTHKFDNDHPLLNFTSFYSNFVRGSLKSIYYLDHGIFAKKELLEKIGKIPEVDIFEDTELSLKLKEVAKPTLLPFLSETSAVRFTKNGIWKQAMNNQWLKIQYMFKQDHKKMNKGYEKGLDLNADYKGQKK